MLRRFGIGLVKGSLIGGLVLAGLLFGLQLAAVPLWAAYLLAIGSGVLTGLVAGKPIWQQGMEARIEAGLKAVAGALLAAFGLFALTRWLPAVVNPQLLKPGQASTGVGLMFIPTLTAVLGLFFELDNTPGPEKDQQAEEKKPAELGPGRVRISGKVPELEELEQEDQSAQQPQKRNQKR